MAERHIGVGLRVADIVAQKLPLPLRDMTPQCIEEEIISYADLFYSKNVKKLWEAKRLEKIRRNVSKYGEHQLAILAGWVRRFGE